MKKRSRKDLALGDLVLVWDHVLDLACPLDPALVWHPDLDHLGVMRRRMKRSLALWDLDLVCRLVLVLECLLAPDPAWLLDLDLL